MCIYIYIYMYIYIYIYIYTDISSQDGRMVAADVCHRGDAGMGLGGVYVILYYTILYYTILYYYATFLYSTILYHATLHYTTLHYTTLYYNKRPEGFKKARCTRVHSDVRHGYTTNKGLCK